MSARSIERFIYAGGLLLALALVAVFLVSPLEAIWTAAIIFAVAAAAFGVQTVLLDARHRRRGDRPRGSAHSPSAP